MSDTLIGKITGSKVENSPHRIQIEKWLEEGKGPRVISRLLKDQFDEDISYSSIDRYSRNRAARSRVRAEGIISDLEREGIIEHVNAIVFLRSVVAKVKAALDKNELDFELKDGIQAAKILLEKDKSNEFIIQIMGDEDYRVLVDALEMISDGAKSEIIEAIKRVRDQVDKESDSDN